MDVTFGLPMAGTQMKEWALTGSIMVDQIRAKLQAPHEQKVMRQFGTKEAAALINRSESWLRDYCSKSVVQEGNGRRLLTLEQINQIRAEIGTLYRRPRFSKVIKLLVSNFKGGVAKTTTTVNCAQKLALQGLRVLVLDFDPQATCTFALGCLNPNAQIHQDDTIRLALLEDPTYIRRVIRKTYFHGIDLIPANISLVGTEEQLTKSSAAATTALGEPQIRLLNALFAIEDDYDLIIIDSGPNLGMLTQNALFAADGMLIPCPPKMYDMASMNSYMDIISDIFHELGKNLTFFRILLTKAKTVSAQDIETEQMMRALYGHYVMASKMADLEAISRTSQLISTVYDTVPRKDPDTNKDVINRESLQRAKMYVDEVNNELLNAFRSIWAQQAAAYQDAQS